MLDQSFSNTNFNLIFLSDNRKGEFNKSYFSKEYLEKHEEFKKVIKTKSALKAKRILTKKELEDFATKLELINNEKEEIRLKIFKELADKISNKNFQFKMDYFPSKEVFTIRRDAASYYAIKQLQLNISRTFKVIQSNRNQIVKQLFKIISDGYPKIIIKTDVRSFYESIPQDRLITKIEDNTLLSPSSKKLIRKLFFEFENIKDPLKILPKRGIPRGIGVSAFLSELYMRDIDNEIKNSEDVIFYERYVDDIVVIFSPKTQSTKGNYIESIRQIIEKHDLKLKDGSDGNENKTSITELFNKKENLIPKAVNDFNYLGYKFIISQSVLHRKVNTDFKIEISDEKLIRYKERIKESIAQYNISAKFNEKRARHILFERIKFLSGNYHLNHTKRNIKAGIFYSNSLLLLNKNIDQIYSLKRIQYNFCKELTKLSPPVKDSINSKNLIRFIWGKFNFINGFFDKENYFFSFHLTKNEESFYFKKYGRAVSKFEIIKSIWVNE